MKKIHLLFIMIIISSCTSDNRENSVLSETTIFNIENSSLDKNELDKLKLVALTGDTKIPLKEAKELALHTANQMREVEGIVTKAPIKIASVEVIKDGVKKEYVKTKGAEEKADLYLLNFENNQGYVLTSADRRVPGVFAYNSVGHLGDTIYNPGQAILLERVMYYMQKKKEEFKKNRLKLAIIGQEELFKKLSKKQQEKLIKKGLFDKNGKRIVTKILSPDCWALPYEDDYYNEPEYQEPPRYEYGSWETVYKKAPLVKTLWNQSGLYNDKVEKYCSNKEDQAPVGCVAVAVGQIMAYHKKPYSFKDKYMNWDDMTYVRSGDMFSQIYFCNYEGKADIQHLLARLGDDEYLDMDYDCDKGSGAYDTAALNTFHELGYTATEQDYDSDKVIFEIKNNRPVYVSGSSIRKKTPWYNFWREYDYKKGHAWALDGYVKRSQEVTVFESNNCVPPNEISDDYINTYYNTIELVHNNFGWGGDEKGGDNVSYYDKKKDKWICKSKTGWYHKNLFDSNNFRDETSNTYKSGTEGNFQYKNKIIINIK